MQCSKLFKEALDKIEASTGIDTIWVRPKKSTNIPSGELYGDNHKIVDDYDFITKDLADNYGIDYIAPVISDWVKDSKTIVRDYINKGKHKELDEFFENTKPTYKGYSSRIGMINKDMLNKIKVGDLATNSFPFASSKNSEENIIFSTLVDNRLKTRPDKVKVRYIIDNSNAPQYDLTGVNYGETEVLIKPKTDFMVGKINMEDDIVTIRLSASSNKGNKKAIPLLSATTLLPLAYQSEEQTSQ